MPYTEIFAAFPSELQLPLARLVDTLKADLDLQRSDFAPLHTAVRELVTAQARTEVRLEELATAQARTQAQVDRLSNAVEALAAAQARTEQRVEELAAAQARTQDALTLFRHTFTS